MKIFVYEYTCCQPQAEGTADSLRAEGRAMLTAVLSDFAALDGVTVQTMLAEDHPPLPFPSHRTNPANEERVFRELAAWADASLVIAPEFDDLLYDRCRWVEESGGRLLGPDSQGVGLAGDKRELSRILHLWGVPMPKSIPLGLVRTGEQSVEFPAVCKPRHGAGSQSIFLLQDRDELMALAASLPASDFIVQPFVAGVPASVAFLLGEIRWTDKPGAPATGHPVAGAWGLCLPAAAQRLSQDGRFRYLGGSAPLAPSLARRAQKIASSAAELLSGILKGYVGVDIVLGDAPDGSADWVIEINPRLTTSYVGLRALARVNLAGVLLGVVQGRALPKLGWQEGTVAWSADGTVTASF
ncbi:MAG: ATP-grasp domain-containing protein [Planctomycetes bacterium]|nr:ATP-grasp domain-containing protein [Planctomycetota bacterium]